MNKFTALLATIATFGKELVGLDGPITAEQVTEANSALAREGVKGVELVSSDALKALREAKATADSEATARKDAAAKRVAEVSALLKDHGKEALNAEATEEDAISALVAHAKTLGSTTPAVPHTGAAAPAASNEQVKYPGHDEALAALRGEGAHSVATTH